MKRLMIVLTGILLFAVPLWASQIRVETSYAGPSGYCVVSLPENYDPEKLWPAVFCYHGRGGKPTTLPYKNFTENKNFVLVGVDYHWNSMDTKSKVDRDAANAKRLIKKITTDFSVHPNYIFIAGNSAGGFLASGIAEKDPTLWAGLMILGAGRYEHLHKRPTVPGIGSTNLFGGFHIAMPKEKRTGLAGMPIYVGAGSSDENHWWAEKAASYYKSKGAAVIFETYPGRHGHYPKTEILSRFFEEFGPLREAKINAAQAENAEKNGDLGKAYEKYQEVSGTPGDYSLVAEAGLKAGDLKQKAEDLFDEAKKANSEGRKEDAVQALRKASSIFRGCDLGIKAKSALIPIMRNPEKDNSRRVNSQANQLEKKARQAESSGEYLAAFKLYDLYLTRFQEAERYSLVRKHYLSLKEDPGVKKAMEEQRTDQLCQNWFNMAKNFLRAGEREKAREYLQKILQRGDKIWVQKAQTILERIS